MNLETFVLKFASRKFHDMADNTWYLLVIFTFNNKFKEYSIIYSTHFNVPCMEISVQ